MALVVAASVCAAVAVSYLVVAGVDTAAIVLACFGLVVAGVDLTMARRDVRRVGIVPADIDVVTGLMTRAAFGREVDRMLADDNNTVVGVVALDIVDFAAVNNDIGYAIADELLWVIGRRAAHRLGSEVVFARLEGDHFGQRLLPDLQPAHRHLCGDRGKRRI